MKIKKKDRIIANSLIMLFTSILLVFSYGNLIFQVVLFVSIAIGIILNNRNDFSSPNGLFILIYTLYSISYPLHNIINYTTYDPFVCDSLLLHTFGLVGFYASSSLFKSDKAQYSTDTFQVKKGYLYAIWGVGLLFTILFVYKASISGASNKQELSENSGGVLYYFVLLYILASSYITISLSFSSNMGKWLFIIFNTSVLFVAYLYSGERDVVFKYVFFCILFSFDVKYKFKRWYYFPLVLLIFIILPLSQFYKAAMLSSSEKAEFIIAPEELFIGEFISSGRNVSKLLEYENRYSGTLLPGERVVFDVLRFLRIKQIDNEDVASTGAWYNAHVLPSIGLYPNSGWGFSWVGFLYISLGYIGPIIGMFLLGMCLNYSYKRRFVSIDNYVFYILFLAVALYIQRADLANLLGQVVKFTIIPIILINIMRRLTLRRSSC
ncbi:O-antigen polymerase [Vibrio harveyi]